MGLYFLLSWSGRRIPCLWRVPKKESSSDNTGWNLFLTRFKYRINKLNNFELYNRQKYLGEGVSVTMVSWAMMKLMPCKKKIITLIGFLWTSEELAHEALNPSACQNTIPGFGKPIPINKIKLRLLYSKLINIRYLFETQTHRAALLRTLYRLLSDAKKSLNFRIRLIFMRFIHQYH